ncbi:MAG: hypothetical protein WAW37_08060 [Syntrophobacteraceae bacterium]
MPLLPLLFLIINALVLLVAPRRWAHVPFIIVTLFMTYGQVIEVGPLHFTIIRVIIAVGILRVVLRREWPTGGIIGFDWLMVVWACWVLGNSPFHDKPMEAFINRLGLFYNTCGVYFLFRSFFRSLDDVFLVCRSIAILLLPVATLMLYERIMAYNLFNAFGGVPQIPDLRAGTLRAQGAFAHPILAGTVGAVCMPLMVGLWKSYRTTSVAGIWACLLMIFASASSGPILSAMAAVVGLLAWYRRWHMNVVRWTLLVSYVALDVLMQAPAYFLIARIDFTGGSTGWHRAELIKSASQHIGEWWLWGTDFTRHWMPTGVPWSPDHTDITNHFIATGVLGGLLLMVLLIATFAKAFSYLGQVLHSGVYDTESEFMVWALGTSLFTFTVTSTSVSYFDQSFVFLYMILAAAGSIWASAMVRQVEMATFESFDPTMDRVVPA